MFYDNFVRLCAAVGKKPTVVAAELGISRSNVSSWKTGRCGASDTNMIKIADYFGITLEELRKDSCEKSISQNNKEQLQRLLTYGTHLRVLRTVTDEQSLHSDENTISWFLSESDENDSIAVSAPDDSMNLSGIMKGAVVIVKKSDKQYNGKIVLVKVDEKSAILRKIVFSGFYITLIPHSANDSYQAEMINKRAHKVSILGVVKEVHNYYYDAM